MEKNHGMRDLILCEQADSAYDALYAIAGMRWVPEWFLCKIESPALFVFLRPQRDEDKKGRGF
ncbi:MAG: hypothetical protein SPG32_12355 [Candidatus Ventricola sp.]|nr:hypothetical protein [Candidatus Ventricola sp.]